MSDERGFGADMVPEMVQEWAPEDVIGPPAGTGRVPATEVEREECVNADVLRRACHVRIDELIAKVRSLSPRGCINTRNLALLAAQDLEAALNRYLHVERTFRPDR